MLRSRLIPLVPLAMLVLAASACGGSGHSTAGTAQSLTKKAMAAHGTKYDSIACAEPTPGHVVCQAIGSNAVTNLDAWCTVQFDAQGTLMAFDPSHDCHWPVVNQVTHSAPNAPIVTTPGG